MLTVKFFHASTSFISKHEGPKTIIEGSGSVKVKNEQKSANFKYISTQLTEGNEQGIEVVWSFFFLISIWLILEWIGVYPFRLDTL